MQAGFSRLQREEKQLEIDSKAVPRGRAVGGLQWDPEEAAMNMKIMVLGRTSLSYPLVLVCPVKVTRMSKREIWMTLGILEIVLH